MALPFAVVHGRFQPFHIEHLAYCRLALARGETLVVGITNFDPDVAVPEATSPGRHRANANPFTYWERALMVRDALLEDGLPAERFITVAFPIHHPERWRHYVPCDPAESLHVVRVYSSWEAEKVRRLRAAGAAVEAIEEPVKRLSGTEVRARIAADERWQLLVPRAVQDWIVRLDGVRRCRGAMETEGMLGE
jgi:nicotinamide-nucleotide adenylyltransferase